MREGQELALELRAAYDAISPEIEAHTSEVCPSCSEVCCIERHGRHEHADEVFLLLLGKSVGEGESELLGDDTMPCRHLGPSGCALPRWQRPYRCTWFFCTPLIEHMKSDPRSYRRLLLALDRLGALRLRLVEAGEDGA